jgi:hypothetical protein
VARTIQALSETRQQSNSYTELHWIVSITDTIIGGAWLQSRRATRLKLLKLYGDGIQYGEGVLFVHVASGQNNNNNDTTDK